MDDDWGLHAVVRGCSGAGAAAPSLSTVVTATTATTMTTTRSPTYFVSDFDFQSFNNNNNNNNSSFLFSSSSSFGNNNNSQSGLGSGQLFSLSSDPITVRPHNNQRVFVEELYKPFFVPKPEANNCLSICTASSHTTSTNTNTTIPNTIISSFSSSSSSNDRQFRPLQPLNQLLNNKSSSSNKHSHAGSVSSSTGPRSKKRKNQLKKVCQVPAESLSSDIWAWRKYGQKPIKGSPFPRGYYRCSSSKGCSARKQVERNRSDPGMFIVTYTSEHNHPAPTHRNSLAGSTRQKPALAAAGADDPSKPLPEAKPSSPATSPGEDLAAALSGSATESKEGPESSTMLMEDEEDDEFGLSDMAVSDDFFVGLEGLGAPATGDYISDNFPASFGLPWSTGGAATAAGGI